MEFKEIDLKSWDRKYYYDYFMKKENKMRCRFGMTAHVDIAELLPEIKNQNLRFYPTIIYLISRVLNNHEYFRISKKDGVLGVFNTLNSRCPIFNEEKKNVTSIWLEYNIIFKKFYNHAIEEMDKYKGIKSMFAKGDIPPNFYDITSVPWVSFTDFQIDMYETDGTWLMPFIAVGKFFQQGDKVLLPVHIKVHHALCDGYHVGMFYKELQQLCMAPNHWM